MDKDPDAFRTISEVAADLDVPQHVLRFWETRFSQIKPMKRGGGRRYYRPSDVDLLKGIKHLLYGEGYTIKGVQRILRDSGVRHVQSIWQEDGQSTEERETSAPPELSVPEPAPSLSRGGLSPETDAIEPTERPNEDAPRDRRAVQAPLPETTEPLPAADISGQSDAELRRDLAFWVQKQEEETVRQPEHAGKTEAGAKYPKLAVGSEASADVSPEGLRQIKAALYELAECRRILETVRET